MPHAVFRADASPTIGGGHIMRCLALANALAATDWACTFVVGAETSASIPALTASLHGVAVTDVPDNTDAVRRCAPMDVLVVDHYGLDAAYEQRCRLDARAILVIDDLADRSHDADLLMDATLGRAAADYAPLLPRNCRVLLGPSFALLRPEFAALREQALQRRGGWLRRVLVCLGNSDPHDMTSRALDALESCGSTLAVDVVLGGKSPNLATVAERVERLGPDIRLHVDTPDVARLMCEADLAISSCGTISWERCVLGLPAIAIITADNQRLIARNLADEGAIALAGNWSTLTAKDLAAALAGFNSSPDRLAAMAATAARVCDGAGARRVAQAVIELAA